MLSNRDYKRLHYIIHFAYIAVFAFLVFLAFRYVFGTITPFIIAFLVAFLIEPAVHFLTEKARFPRPLACSLCVIIVLVLVVIIGSFLSATIWTEGKALIKRLPSLIIEVIDYLKAAFRGNNGMLSFVPDNILNSAADYLANYDYSTLLTGSFGGLLLGYAGNVVTYIPNILVFSIVTIVSSFFMSISFPTVKRFFLAQFDQKHQDLIVDIKNSFFSTIWKYIRSYSILLSVTFVELLIFFLVFDFKPALPLALMIAFVDILPVLGVGTVLIPWSVFSLLTGNPWKALILICMYIVITVVRQILEPKIIGDHVGMLPILTLFCIWVGLKLFGFTGMFLFPITVVILKNLQEEGKIKLWKNIDTTEKESKE